MDRRRPRLHRRVASPGPGPPGRTAGADQSGGVLRLHPGASEGALQARRHARPALAPERVHLLGSGGGKGGPAPVSRPGAAPAVADLYEGLPRRGRALRGEADRLARGAPGGRSAHPAGAGHRPVHRFRVAVAAGGMGHLSAADLRGADRHLHGRPRRGGASGHAARRLHGAGAPLSARHRESGRDRGAGGLRGPAAQPEPRHVALRGGRPRLPRAVRSSSGP
jgi:hypothetical protein